MVCYVKTNSSVDSAGGCDSDIMVLQHENVLQRDLRLEDLDRL